MRKIVIMIILVLISGNIWAQSVVYVNNKQDIRWIKYQDSLREYNNWLNMYNKSLKLLPKAKTIEEFYKIRDNIGWTGYSQSTRDSVEKGLIKPEWQWMIRKTFITAISYTQIEWVVMKTPQPKQRVIYKAPVIISDTTYPKVTVMYIHKKRGKSYLINQYEYLNKNKPHIVISQKTQ